MNMDYPLHRNLLVADNETFAEAEPSIIKAVDGDYRSQNYVLRNTRYDGPSYFGWILMRAHEVVELWKHLDYDELDTLARRSIGGSRQGIWANDCY
jgi:hypothetical protein